MFLFITNWRLYKKMGYKGWVHMIPIYNTFCCFEALYNKGWLMFLPGIISFGGAILYGICMLIMSNTMRNSNLSIEEMINTVKFWNVAGIMIIIVCAIAILAFIIKYIIDFTHAFGKRGWWTVGALLFFPVFVCIYSVSDFKFNGKEYPDYDNYDAIDGFFDFFRNWRSSGGRTGTKNIVCKNCGAILRENAEFCGKCGVRVE